MSIWVIDARQGSVLHLDFRLCGPKAKSDYFERVAEAAANHFRVVVSSGVVCRGAGGVEGAAEVGVYEGEMGLVEGLMHHQCCYHRPHCHQHH